MAVLPTATESPLLYACELWVFAMCPALRGSTVSYAGDAHFPKHSLEYSLNFWSQSKKKKHHVAVETMKKRDKARVECRLEVEAEALPHKAAMRQPSLQSVMASCNDKNKAAHDTMLAFTGAGIPLDKLDCPLMRAWLQKYTIASCLPQGSCDFPKVNGHGVLDGQ